MPQEQGHKLLSRTTISIAIVLHSAVFLVLSIGITSVIERAGGLQSDLWRTAGSAVGLGAFGSILSLVCLGLFRDSWRARIVHWRWRHPLPGSRAFTEIGPADDRVNMDTLRGLYGDLPNAPAEQNSFWYRIYKTHRTDASICEASKTYLAARDLAALNFLLVPTLPVALWLIERNGEVVACYAGGLLLFYTLSALAAQSYGVRLVQNALTVASTSNHHPKGG